MDRFIPPSVERDATTETRDRLVSEKMQALWDSLPPEWRDFILARLEEEDTGTLPPPPTNRPAPVLTPPTP